MMSSKGWTREARARQAELIRQWKPWQRSTGPTTAEGKARVSRNAERGRVRPALRELAELLREVERQRYEMMHDDEAPADRVVGG